MLHAAVDARKPAAFRYHSGSQTAVGCGTGGDERAGKPNLARTLAKMASAGFITMKTVGRRKAPSVAVKKIVVEIDPYSDRDRLQVA